MEEPEKTPSFLRRDAHVLFDCRVETESFEGPLDLLLHLIKTHELDIRNFSISKITSQYLAYLDYMREMNLDLASEYLVMAATLTYLKSQVILPQDEKEEETGHDPRTQLIRKLIELKCYKDIAKHLTDRPRLYRDVFPCKNTGAEEIQDGLEPEVAVTNPFQLVEAYQSLIERRKVKTHDVYMDEVPIATSVERLAEIFEKNKTMDFKSLLPESCRTPDFVSTFLAILEITRMQFTTIDQDEAFAPISISRRVDAEDMARANKMIRGMSWN